MAITSNFMKLRWQIFVIVICLAAILLYLLLRFLIPEISPQPPLLAAIVLGGIPAILYIIVKLLKGNLGADSLAAIAIISAVILKQNLAAVLIILMLASGQALEAYAMRKASSVLQALASRMPTIIHRKTSEGVTDFPLSEVRVGDEVIVYPHEACPVDGEVVEGHGSMDESYLTGEPYQISKAPGVAVISGAINGESALTIKTRKLPGDSHYTAIVKVLQEAEQKRPTLRRLGDQLGAIFTPIVLLAALAAWYFSGEVIRFLAVLVIATPCPLIIAIPITIVSAISMAAKRAIIIKDPTVLERLPTCRTAIFDKTGTLTYGKPSLIHIFSSNLADEKKVLQLAASLERYSKHPLSNAIQQAAKDQQLPLLDACSVTEKPGQGLMGIITHHKVQIISRKKYLELFPGEIEQLPAIAAGLECLVLINEKYAATFQFQDVPRAESKSFIKHLKPFHRIKKIMLVSGDRETEVKELGAQLNLKEVYALQTPAEKLAITREQTAKAPTLFLGDGINDAPALTSATVGIAFGQYSNVTAEAAGAVVMEHSLAKVDELFHLSLLTRKIALQSAIGGMALSFIGMGFAAAGYISPVAGALLQEVIDVLAILNSLRLIWVNKIYIDLPNPGKRVKTERSLTSQT